MKLISNEYYWVVYNDEHVVGLYTNEYGFPSWTMCGTETILDTSDIIVISHIERPNQ